jgi:hypothetical protein
MFDRYGGIAAGNFELDLRHSAIVSGVHEDGRDTSEAGPVKRGYL